MSTETRLLVMSAPLHERHGEWGERGGLSYPNRCVGEIGGGGSCDGEKFPNCDERSEKH